MLGFRVWDDKHNLMSDKSFCMGEDGSVFSFDECCDTHRDLNLNRYIPMQSTGFKDREGNEIFSGDIIHFIGGSIVLIEDSRELGIMLFNRDAGDIPYHLTCLILGNRYQHPELLEKLK